MRIQWILIPAVALFLNGCLIDEKDGTVIYNNDTLQTRVDTTVVDSGVNGLVIDQTGKPLANVKVYLNNSIDYMYTNCSPITVDTLVTDPTTSNCVWGGYSQIDSALTNSNGIFHIGVTADGIYDLNGIYNIDSIHNSTGFVSAISVANGKSLPVIITISTLIDTLVACPAIYAPVCGSNGLTYGNSCEADAAGISYTSGECPTTVTSGCALVDCAFGYTCQEVATQCFVAPCDTIAECVPVILPGVDSTTPAILPAPQI